MKTVAIVGCGDIGTVIARLASNAGRTVYLSNSRGPETLADLAETLGAGASAVTVDQAIAKADVIVITVPFGRILDLPLSGLEDKIVIDAMNYVPSRDGAMTSLFSENQSPPEWLQSQIPQSMVVKAFNNIHSGHLERLSRPAGSPDRSALPIAGDDAQAKTIVANLLSDMGWDSVDVGPLAAARRFEVVQPAFVKAYMAEAQGSPEEWGLKIAADPGAVLSEAQLRILLNMAE